MPPLVRKIEPGDVIGRCRTIRELGRGGVGTVYLATHQTLKIEVALKVLSPALSLDNPALAERFIRESQLTARIRHPNVVAVMDAGHDEASGLYYIVMEFVGGGSLSWHLRKGPLPEARALSITADIAHALVVAEDNRIVHRDIKPDNIMLDLRGTAKLADLGMAKHELDSSNASLTLGGSFMGTPAYMSPDQARDARDADTRDDIYSLGASFYECLTGQPPFQGETPYNIMSELLTKPSPRPCALRPGISRSADLICRKMMAKSRDLRYANARAVLKDLQHAQLHGDRGLEELEASDFDHDAIAAHQHEVSFGIKTSSDGVYADDELADTSPDTPRPAPLPVPHRLDHNVFSAAALLIILVVAVTLFFAWAGPNHPLLFLKKEWALLSGEPAPSTILPAKPEEPIKHELHLAKEKDSSPQKSTLPTSTSHHTQVAIVPFTLTNLVTTPAPPGLINEPPVVLPESIASGTNAAMPNPPIPFAPLLAGADSAFAARDIAESSLPPEDIAPTGRAELLRIIGDRTPGQTTPTVWKYYFFERHASGNARIVTVTDGKMVKSGQDLADFASPYEEAHVIPEDKLLVDSTQALQIAQGLVPGINVDSAEYALLQQKNSEPMWKVTLWTRNAAGEDRKLGDVMLRAETGAPYSIKLTQ